MGHDLQVVHAFQLVLEVQVVHHVLLRQVDLEGVVAEVVVVEGVGVVGAVVLNNTHLNKMVHKKLDIHNRTGLLLSCNIWLLRPLRQ